MVLIEGNVSVKAALLAGRRNVDRILVDQNKEDRDTRWILHEAERRGVTVEKKSRDVIDAMASGRTHGGLIAEAEGRTFQKEEDVLKTECPFLVLAEGVEDPFNLGYIMRTLYSAGCDGLILRKRNWENAESTILKSSAGASEYLSIIMSEDPASSLARLRKKGLVCYEAMRKNAIGYDEADYRKPVVLAIGGEMRGLSSSVRHESDQNIYIPYANDFRNALNAAAATAVLSYEVFRQRKCFQNNCK